jgi:hypothetical protein
LPAFGRATTRLALTFVALVQRVALEGIELFMDLAERRIRRLVKAHRDWLVEAGPEVLARSQEELRQNLAHGSVAGLVRTAWQLSCFALYYGAQGVVRLADEDPIAWDDIYLSATFRLHELRLRYTLWTRVGHADPPHIKNMAGCWCFAVTNDLPYWEELAAEMLKQAAWNEQMVNCSKWSDRKYEPFVLELSQRNIPNSERAAVVGDWEAYADLLAAWNDAGGLTSPLEAICDYHCGHMFDTAAWDPEFDETPFDYIAWELLAVRRLRERAGLETIDPDHPLVTPLESFAPRKYLPFDERIEAVDQLCIGLGMGYR